MTVFEYGRSIKAGGIGAGAVTEPEIKFNSYGILRGSHIAKLAEA